MLACTGKPGSPGVFMYSSEGRPSSARSAVRTRPGDRGAPPDDGAAGISRREPSSGSRSAVPALNAGCTLVTADGDGDGAPSAEADGTGAAGAAGTVVSRLVSSSAACVRSATRRRRVCASSTRYTASTMHNIVSGSLWSPPMPHSSTIGFRPTIAIARRGSWPSRDAQRATSTTTARLHAIRIPLMVQNDAATPSGTSAKVMIVNSGPYGLSRWCQLLIR